MIINFTIHIKNVLRFFSFANRERELISLEPWHLNSFTVSQLLYDYESL